MGRKANALETAILCNVAERDHPQVDRVGQIASAGGRTMREKRLARLEEIVRQLEN